MASNDDSRSVEQEVAEGRNEATPFIALGSVIVVIAVLFLIVLAIVVAAYQLA